MVATAAIAGAVLYRLFADSGSVFRDLVAAATFLVLMPLACLRYVVGATAEDLGLGLGDWRRGITWAIVSYAAALVAFLLLVRFGFLADGYAMPVSVMVHFWAFIGYAVVLLLYTAVFEVFFHGIIVGGLRAEYGLWTVVAQFLPLLLFRDLVPNTASLFLILPLTALSAYYARSVWYGLVAHFLFVATAEAVMITVLRSAL